MEKIRKSKVIKKKLPVPVGIRNLVVKAVKDKTIIMKAEGYDEFDPVFLTEKPHTLKTINHLKRLSNKDDLNGLIGLQFTAELGPAKNPDYVNLKWIVGLKKKEEIK